MFKKMFKWLDKAWFPVPTADEYMRETLEEAKLALAKAHNDADYSLAIVAYRSAQIERLEKTINSSTTVGTFASAS